jgi:hypothetical protein
MLRGHALAHRRKREFPAALRKCEHALRRGRPGAAGPVEIAVFEPSRAVLVGARFVARLLEVPF